MSGRLIGMLRTGWTGGCGKHCCVVGIFDDGMVDVAVDVCSDELACEVQAALDPEAFEPC